MLERAITRAGGPYAFEEVLRSLPEDQVEQLAYCWELTARPSQLPPPGDWLTWLVLAGRGWGKTLVGSQMVRAEVESGRAGRLAIVGATAADVRKYCVEGETGLLAVSPPWFRPIHEPSKTRVVWPNGAVAQLLTAEEPDRLRGDNIHFAWLDELASYQDPDHAWEQVQFTLRLGPRPRSIVTTTPRPVPIITRRLTPEKNPTVVVTRGRTLDNPNLPQSFVDSLLMQFGSSRLGRQEMDAEILTDNPSALWKLDDIDETRVRNTPELRRIVVAIDPAVSTNRHSNETGIVVAGVGDCYCKGTPELHAFVLGDYSGIFTPAEWAREVRAAYSRHRADRVIAEVNQGGDLVEENLRANGAGNLPITKVHASRGKAIRAEPVAALYEQRKVHHLFVAKLQRLEDQMTQWSPLEDATSPDRVDALVWGLSHLMTELGAGGVEFELPGRPIMPRRR